MAWLFWGLAKGGGARSPGGTHCLGGTPAYEALFICSRHYPLWGLGRQPSSFTYAFMLSNPPTHADNIFFRPGRKSSRPSTLPTSLGTLLRRNLLRNHPSFLRPQCRLMLPDQLLSLNMLLLSLCHSPPLRLFLPNMPLQCLESRPSLEAMASLVCQT